MLCSDLLDILHGSDDVVRGGFRAGTQDSPHVAVLRASSLANAYIPVSQSASH